MMIKSRTTPFMFLLLVILFIGTSGSVLIGAGPEVSDLSELVSVVRIPTGSKQEALRMERELDRAGLGLRFDRGRMEDHIEAAIPIQNLMQLADSRDSILSYEIRNWETLRNISRREIIRTTPGRSLLSTTSRQTRGDRHHLPIHKDRYHTLEETEHILRALVSTYPDRAKLHSIGRTSRNENIWSLELSTTDADAPGRWKPSILLTGSFHGDDRVGRELCLWIAEYLCEEYSSSSSTRRLMDQLRIHIIPDPSPDATRISTRYTTRGIDIDRGFPDRVQHTTDPEFIEREVEHLMDWVREHRPLAAASFLGGGGGPGHAGLIIRYPWNALKYPSVASILNKKAPARAPDDRAFRYLARDYADKHPTLANDDPRPEGVDKGLVNGAEWYSRYGSFQDWFYSEVGSPHIDIVLSPYLKPMPDRLHMYWEHNRQAVLSFLRTADRYGVRGTVVDLVTGKPVEDAKIVIRDLNDRSRHLHSVTTNSRGDGAGGEFARFVVPGRYALTAEAPGYTTSSEYLFNIDQTHPIHQLHIHLSVPQK